MATIKFKNLADYEMRISRLGRMTKDICGRSIYEGAKIVADEIRKGVDELPVIRGYGTPANPLPGGVTAAQKEGLQDGLGITPLAEKSGFYNVKIGFDGYNKTATAQHPRGQPNQLVARGAESGTSWKMKSPFVRPAVNRAKAAAEKAMAEALDKEIKKTME